jgi:hypothetical protein
MHHSEQPVDVVAPLFMAPGDAVELGGGAAILWPQTAS